MTIAHTCSEMEKNSKENRFIAHVLCNVWTTTEMSDSELYLIMNVFIFIVLLFFL